MADEILRFKDLEREIILIPTAHVSQKSAEMVAQVIEEEKPDVICVELCEQRHEQIKNPNRFEEMDIIKVIKHKKSMFLLANLVLSAYQRKMAKGLGIEAGSEMLAGVRLAEETGATLVLADRSIQTTFSRIWYGMGFREKGKVLIQLLMSLFDDESLSEEDLEELKQEDMLTAALSELSVAFPMLKKPLVDERDTYLAEKIWRAQGQKVVAIVGAAHVPGIKSIFSKKIEENISPSESKQEESKPLKSDEDVLKVLDEVPKKKKNKILPWLIPGIIVAILIATFSLDVETGLDQLAAWVLWNGILAAVGAIIAWAHPLTILTAFVVAPITSLNPLLAAGWFAGLVEAMIRKPNVKDLKKLSEDILSVKGFWKNRVTRILLIIAFCNLGSVIGTLIGGSEIILKFIRLL